MSVRAPEALITDIRSSPYPAASTREITENLVQFRQPVHGWTAAPRIFEDMRKAAHKSGWREVVLELIDDKLKKASISKDRYERAQRELMHSWRGPSSLLCTRYDPETDSHIKFVADVPGNLPNPAVYEHKRRSVAALKGWHKRRSKEVLKRNLLEKREIYADQNTKFVQHVDSQFARLATLPALQHPHFRARLNGSVDELKRPGPDSSVGYAGLATFQFRADRMSAPVLVDRVTEALKGRGLYGAISSEEFQTARDRFIVHAQGESDRPMRKSTRKKTIYDALKLHTRNFARRVFLAEEPHEGIKPAAEVRIKRIMRRETDAVWDIYSTADALQRAAEEKNTQVGGWMTHQWYGNNKFSAELAKVFRSPLITKGGILEVTPQQIADTSYRTSRPFIGFENTRPFMLLASLAGVKKEVLSNIPLPVSSGEKEKFLDTRLAAAIARAEVENIAAGRPASDYLVPEHGTVSGFFYGDVPYPPPEK